MFEFKNAYKRHNETTLSKLNFQIDDSVAVIGPCMNSCNLILKLLCGLYSLDKGEVIFDKFFFIPQKQSIIFNTIFEIVEFFYVYYLYDKCDVLSFFELNGFDVQSSINENDKKIIFLIIGLFSKQRFIIVENFFDNVSFDMKNRISNFISKYNLKLIATSNDLSKLSNLVSNFIYVDKKVSYFNFNDFSSNFYKAYLCFRHDIYEKDFLSYNPIFTKIFNKSLLVILRRDKVDEFLERFNPTVVDVLSLDLEDVFYLGDYL